MESKLQLILENNEKMITKFEEQNRIVNRLVRPDFLEPLGVKKSVSEPQLSSLIKKIASPCDWVVVDNNNLKKR